MTNVSYFSQYTVNEAPLYQEKVNSLNEFSSNLMADPCLGEEGEGQTETRDCSV